VRGKVVAAVLVPTLLVASVGAYAWADANDLAPGVLTNEPLPSPQPPLLTASPLAVATPSAGPVGPVDLLAPLPSPDAVLALAQALRDDDRTGSSTNVYVADLTTGEVLASLDGSDPQVPASTTKLLTAVAALEVLGPDYTFDTRVSYAADSGRLTLIAGGDVMLASEAGHHGEAVNAEGEVEANGWAGLGDLAAQIAETVPVGPVTLAVDTSDFPGPSYPASWPAYALELGYAGRVEGIAVNVGKKDGITAAEYGARDKEPAVRALRALATALKQLGYQVTVEGKASEPSGSQEVARVSSAPLSLVVTEFLRYSDNTVAEQTARVVGLKARGEATPEAAAAATIDALDAIGAPTDGLVLYDGAGFSDKNRVMPQTLVASLVKSPQSTNGARLLDYLPLSGLEGTVNKRFRGTPVAGFMRAKTGSLTGVTTLAGVVTTADGRQLAFATLLDGMPAGQKRPMAAVDDFVNALAECGCAG
jgi:D-alanyl-D-alanine carboxypeptidase/D-alanyl-D-alanine-endopeptidase (penicillin-binding protein 4)